ncbi:hypothetical protein AcW1_002614 [Taiwanofungus camphoratus]|nr:hypothetical protein AcV5_009704 [Antrodia cinnamomea]KAI0943458.1 hypothetical protein AcW1_002614 [Antrodia cinnamomea]
MSICNLNLTLQSRATARFNDNEFFHTYAWYGSFDTGRSKAPSLFAKLASLGELTAWLPRVFLDTTLPGRSKKPPYKIRPPNNLVAFFGLLAHLHCVGFPAHWLSDFPKGIVPGSMITDIEGILRLHSWTSVFACGDAKSDLTYGLWSSKT